MLNYVSQLGSNGLENLTNSIWNNWTLMLYCALSYVLYKSYQYEMKLKNKDLAGLPGPLSLPFIGIMYMFIGSKTPLSIMYNMAYKYPIMEKPFKFTFGPYLMIGVARPEDVKAILNSPHALQKAIVYSFIKPFLGNGLMAAPVEIWKRHRKTINPTFHQKILDTFVPIFGKHSSRLVERLRDHVGKGEFNIIYDMSKCTLDMVCDTVMGVSFNTTKTEGEPPYIKAVANLMKTVNRRIFSLWLYSDVVYRLSGIEKKEMEEKQIAQSFSNKVVQEKLKLFNERNGEIISEDGIINRKRFLDLLIDLTQHDSEQRKWTTEELREEVDTLLVTGTETSAAANSLVLMMLGIYSEIQAKVVQELQEIFGDTKRDVELEDLPKMQYLERVIKETLRIFPNGPLIARETSKEIKLEHCTVPRGTTVVIYVRRLHLDPELWGDDANTFDPDRFTPERSVGRHPYAYIPFSAGPRNCVGYRYAIMAMKCLLANIIRNFTIQCSYKMEDIKLKTNLTLKPLNGYKIMLLDRNPTI